MKDRFELWIPKRDATAHELGTTRWCVVIINEKKGMTVDDEWANAHYERRPMASPAELQKAIAQLERQES